MLAETVGYFTRRDVLDSGLADKDLTAGCRSGSILRLRRGYFTFPDLWDDLDERDRHLVMCRAVLDALGDCVALSHVSAAAAHGLCTWGVDLSRVHVTRLDKGATRVEGGVVHHKGRSSGSDLVDLGGMRVVRPVRAAIETASMGSSESALVVLDSLLHHGLGDEDELMEQFQRMAHWPATRHLHIPVRMADGRSDGPGESRGRWLFRTAHIPAPTLQFPVYDAGGRLVATCDWGWEGEGVVGEFDGKIKYGRLLRPGQTAGDVVFAEKQREDLVREITGYRMVRLTWSDLDRPIVTAGRVRRLVAKAS